MDLLQIRLAVNVKNNVALVVSVRVLSFTSEDENLTPTMSAIQSAECVEQRQSCFWGADNRMHNQEAADGLPLPMSTLIRPAATNQGPSCITFPAELWLDILKRLPRNHWLMFACVAPSTI